MNEECRKEVSTDDLLSYLGTATAFRNHEFNIQMLRNVVFTGTQAILLAVYAATIDKVNLCAAIVAGFGMGLAMFWRSYYQASLYWVRFWESRCRDVNDLVVSRLGISQVDIFRDHPANNEHPHVPDVLYRGYRLQYVSVSKVVRKTMAVFPVLWAALVVAAIVAMLIGDAQQESPAERLLPAASRLVFNVL